jgi:hypothetical protein
MNLAVEDYQHIAYLLEAKTLTPRAQSNYCQCRKQGKNPQHYYDFRPGTHDYVDKS